MRQGRAPGSAQPPQLYGSAGVARDYTRNQKAKKLASLLKRQPALNRTRGGDKRRGLVSQVHPVAIYRADFAP